MADPHRLRSYLPRPEGYRRVPVRGLSRAWLRLRFDPRVRETILVVLGTVLACHVALSLSADDRGEQTGFREPSATTAQALDALEDAHWMTR